MTYCQACIKASKQSVTALDCEACPGRCPELSQDNEPAWSIWATIQTQWRFGMSGPVGLDYPAVWLVAESMGVEMHAANLGRIRALEREALEHMRKA